MDLKRIREFCKMHSVGAWVVEWLVYAVQCCNVVIDTFATNHEIYAGVPIAPCQTAVASFAGRFKTYQTTACLRRLLSCLALDMGIPALSRRSSGHSAILLMASRLRHSSLQPRPSTRLGASPERFLPPVTELLALHQQANVQCIQSQDFERLPYAWRDLIFAREDEGQEWHEMPI